MVLRAFIRTIYHEVEIYESAAFERDTLLPKNITLGTGLQRLILIFLRLSLSESPLLSALNATISRKLADSQLDSAGSFLQQKRLSPRLSPFRKNCKIKTL
jgi:hypothetical protein